MPRLHLIELHDQPWCPSPVRDGVTDQLRFTSSLLRAYKPIAGRLADALERSESRHLVDLCAGGGGPWTYLLDEIAHAVDDVVLTDYYPNRPAFERAVEASGGRIRFEADSVDATDVPENLEGFRTVFTAFHHFRPEQARSIVQSAVEDGVGIGIFELTERSLSSLALVGLGAPLVAAALTPFVPPFRLSRLLLTYALPLIPLSLVFDGVVSCLRTYSPADLEAIVGTLDAPGYEWEIGVERGFHPMPVTYLIGHPP